MPAKQRLRVATYNIHKCRGLDRKVRPDRIAEVLSEVDADVIALQEVVGPRGESADSDEHDQAALLAAALNSSSSRYVFCFGENRRLKTGDRYGNAILSRVPIVGCENFLLPLVRREQRGCLRADLKLRGPQGSSSIVHVFNVHLGTGFMERRHQGTKLVSEEIVRHAKLRGPRLILGDFNEWAPGITTRLLTQGFHSVDVRKFTGRRRTYPGIFPVLHLDHLYYDDAFVLEEFEVHRSRKALVASDHLPLVAEFCLR